MRAKKAVAVVGAAAMLVATGAFAAFGPRGGREGRRPGAGIKAVLAKLDLSQEQKDRIRGFAEAARPQMQALREQQQANRAALRALVDAATPDAKAIGEAMLKVKAGREALKAERQKLHDATVSVLTPEQRVKLETYLEAFKMMRGGPGRGEGRGARGE